MARAIKSNIDSIQINLQPRQGMFFYLMRKGIASWMGYGGARGGGKSGGLRRFALKLALENPGVRVLILRRVWDDVYKNNVLPMLAEFPELYPHYKETDHSINLPNGAIIFFDSAENRMDVDRKSVGPEFMFIFVDQAEQFSEDELKKLKTICRWPNTPMHQCKFCLFFNPGGQGAGYLQRVFHLKEYQENENEDDFVFLQAFGWDNIEWVRLALKEDGYEDKEFYEWPDEVRFQYFIKKSQYGKELDALDSTMRPGQLLGTFDKFAGQYFTNWDPHLHIWPTQNIIFQPWWPRWIAIDWGFAHWTAVGWFCQVGSVTGDNKLPLTILYRMMTRRRMSERALAEEIVSVNNKERISNVFGGHDLWNQVTAGPTKEQAMSDVFRRAGLPVMKRANNERVNGWRLMHRMLDEGEFIILDNCKEAIQAIPMAVFNEKDKGKNEDVLKTTDMGDDVRDMIRYGLYSAYGPSETPFEETIKQQVAHITDPTARALHNTKLLAEHQRSLQDVGRSNNRSNGRHDRYLARYR